MALPRVLFAAWGSKGALETNTCSCPSASEFVSQGAAMYDQLRKRDTGGRRVAVADDARRPTSAHILTPVRHAATTGAPDGRKGHARGALSGVSHELPVHQRVCFGRPPRQGV